MVRAESWGEGPGLSGDWQSEYSRNFLCIPAEGKGRQWEEHGRWGRESPGGRAGVVVGARRARSWTESPGRSGFDSGASGGAEKQLARGVLFGYRHLPLTCMKEKQRPACLCLGPGACCPLKWGQAGGLWALCSAGLLGSPRPFSAEPTATTKGNNTCFVVTGMTSPVGPPGLKLTLEVPSPDSILSLTRSSSAGGFSGSSGRMSVPVSGDQNCSF